MSNVETIFNEVNTPRRYRYHVTGCEKVIQVRLDNSINFTMRAYTINNDDPGYRRQEITVFNGPQDFCLENFPCVTCGMDILFEIENIDPDANLFTQILKDTCNPEPCCICK